MLSLIADGISSLCPQRHTFIQQRVHALFQYYNIENDAIGFYKLYDNGNNNDSMKIRMKQFDFPGFDGVKLDTGLAIKGKY